MRTCLFTITTAMAVCLALVFSTGCGGGSGPGPMGGPGPVTVPQAGGMWLGSGGAATPGGMITNPMQTTLSADTNGLVNGRTGAIPAQAVTGTIAQATTNILKVTNGAFRALLFFSSDRNHLLYIDNLGNLAALQRDAVAPLPTFGNADILNSQWSGNATDISSLAAFDPVGEEAVSSVAIDGAGMFVSGTSMTNGMPLNEDSTVFGTFFGDYIDAPETGLIGVVLTPDKRFAATISCETPAPGDIAGCNFTALER